MRPADGAEDLAFIGGDLVPGADLAPRAQRVVVGLLDERIDDLVLAHRRDLFRVPRLRVEAAARRRSACPEHGCLPQEGDVAARVRVTRVDDAGDAFALRGHQFLRHQLRIGHRVRRCGGCWAGDASGAGSWRSTGSGSTRLEPPVRQVGQAVVH